MSAYEIVAPGALADKLHLTLRDRRCARKSRSTARACVLWRPAVCRGLQSPLLGTPHGCTKRFHGSLKLPDKPRVLHEYTLANTPSARVPARPPRIEALEARATSILRAGSPDPPLQERRGSRTDGELPFDG